MKATTPLGHKPDQEVAGLGGRGADEADSAVVAEALADPAAEAVVVVGDLAEAREVLAADPASGVAILTILGNLAPFSGPAPTVAATGFTGPSRAACAILLWMPAPFP